MTAILTKTLGYTNTKPRRIKAYTNGVSLTISWEACDPTGDKTTEQVHHFAATQLCKKYGWKGKLIGGGTREGFAFVFVN